MQQDRKHQEILEKIANNESIQEQIQEGYWLQLDLPLPLLIVFHQPESSLALNMLVRGESSYLIVPQKDDASLITQPYVEELVKVRAGQYGSFLLLDIAFDETTQTNIDILYYQQKSQATVNTLQQALIPLKALKNSITISQREVARPQVPHPNLLNDSGCSWIKIVLPRLFARPQKGESYPVLLRNFRDHFSYALRQALYTFLRIQTNYQITHPRTLGRTTVDEAFWHADRQLYEIEQSFRFLMLVSAINLDSAWSEFQASHYQSSPTFYYPILPIDPEERKRALYSVNIDSVHDPALAFLLRDKRKELDIQLDMLNERGSENFLYSSIRLYKTIDEELLKLANLLLEKMPSKKAQSGTYSAQQFAQRAEEEFDYFREQNNQFTSRIHIGNNMPGLMVSRGELYIPENVQLREERVEALVQHEIGTHVLTYYNGAQQPMKLLRLGLADYDELQEGLAVLSEYLTGGLDPLRMRLLAARVVVAYECINHTSFSDAFALLTEQHQFDPHIAFDTVARIYQSGGFTKDLIYLRGFIQLWQHLRQNSSLETLLMGKIAVKHIGVIQALQERQILKPPTIYPRYWSNPVAQQRLDTFRNTSKVEDVVTMIIN